MMITRIQHLSFSSIVLLARYAPVPVNWVPNGSVPSRFGYLVGLVPSQFGTQSVWVPSRFGTQSVWYRVHQS
jgi:hypothetical protein